MNIPYGFALTAEVYWEFVRANGFDEEFPKIWKNLDSKNLKSVIAVGAATRKKIANGVFTNEQKKELFAAYRKLSQKYKVKKVDVAVRTSGVAEDNPDASFAGQFETYLNIVGQENLLQAVKNCFISFFTNRAIVYRAQLKLDQLSGGLSVGVCKMVRSDLGTSGVMFSCDTESGFSDVVLINASYGLGENVVKGRVDPDQFYVFETTLKEGFSPILEKRLGSKLVKLIYSNNKNNPTKDVATSKKERENFCVKDNDILTLARWSMIVENHYRRPMDMEWAKDGKTGELFLVQARPETVQSKKNLNFLEEYILNKSKNPKEIVSGLSVGSKIGQGPARVIMSVKDIEKFKQGEVLITDMTDPDWVPAMKIAKAIVTNRGGRTCHAAIVGRELGVPTVVGTENVTKKIETGRKVTVSCAEGEIGKVFDGIVPFNVKRTDISQLKKTSTKIYMNVGEPSNAFNLSFIPNDGVGLAREEFIIANEIKIHPNALINYKDLNSATKKKIDAFTLGYANKTKFYVDKLAEGIGKIAAAFYPKPVIVRFSDFKTNEYRSLVGGEIFEPKEENPMIGFRGASRYYDPKFKDAFVLELEAIKKARNEFGLINIVPMVPFCRTLDEAKKVARIMAENGLRRGDGLKIYAMCEIPSNIILAESFLEIFDGFSIGSNDLTQLTLGLDRDNSSLALIGNEKNEAVKKLIAEVIKICKSKGKYIGICGQGPSDFPDFAQFLVEEGIDSLSLNPDSVIKTKIAIAEKEKQLEDKIYNKKNV